MIGSRHILSHLAAGRARLAAFAADEAGATALEYALIGAMTSVAIIGGLTLLGTAVNAEWNYVSNTVHSAMNR